MSHLRKKIRRILDDSGCSNCFDLCEINFTRLHEYPAKLLVIKDWTPGSEAIRVKKMIERLDEKVIVDFSLRSA